jgi:hypothetical protein
MVDFLLILSDPTVTHPEKRWNQKFGPYFDGCIRAVDGNHISAVVEEEDQSAFTTTRGFISECVGCY